MFVGEIGISRHEFLYNITFWEARRIIRGYRKRHSLLHQLIAENVYSTIYMMRDAKGKSVNDLFPQLFESDDDEDEESDPISEEDRQQLLADMAAWQQQLDEQRSDED